VLTEHDIKIAPSTFYARQTVSASDWDDAHTANRLFDIWRVNRSLYGATKLHAAALDAGMQIGRDHVARLMRILGVEGVHRGYPTTTTTTRNDEYPRHPDLMKRAWDTPTAPDQWWVADFERHEALLNLAVVKGHRHVLVAAGALKLRAA
jgi:putative transposase